MPSGSDAAEDLVQVHLGSPTQGIGDILPVYDQDVVLHLTRFQYIVRGKRET